MEEEYHHLRVGVGGLRSENHARYLKELNKPEEVTDDKDRRLSYEQDFLSVVDSTDEELVRLYCALQKLTVNQQEIIKRYFFRDMSKEEIAEEMGVSRIAIHRTLVRSVTTLKKLF